MKRAVCLLAVIIPLCSAPAIAQQPGPQPLEGPGTSFGVLSRYDFQLEANVLSGNDGARFRWDAHFGGEFDLIDYMKGRLAVVTDYEAVLSNELRPFDPNQGIYILEPSLSWWVSGHEVAVVFHHVSRHLSDRPKNYATAWNVLEGRYLRRFNVHGTSLAVRASAGKITQHSDVDYRWTAEFDVSARRMMNPRLDLYLRATGETFSVDPAIKGRVDSVHGGRLEVGVRLKGGKGDIDLFAGVEHRLDATPLDYLPVTWAIAGFRIVSK